jgi:hypothetical protein
VPGGVDRLLGVGAGGVQVAEGAQGVGVLGLDEARLDVASLRGFLAGHDPAGHVLGPGHGGVAAVPVADPGVSLSLERVQVGDQRRGQGAAGAAQGGLGVLDYLPVVPPVQSLVGEEGDDVSAEAAVSRRLGHAERLEEVPLRDSLQVGVVGADPGQGREPSCGPVQDGPPGTCVRTEGGRPLARAHVRR